MDPIVDLDRLTFRIFRNRYLTALLQVAQASIDAIAAARAIRGICLGARDYAFRYFACDFRRFRIYALLLFDVGCRQASEDIEAGMDALIALSAIFYIPLQCGYDCAAFFMFEDSLVPNSIFGALRYECQRRIAILYISEAGCFVSRYEVIIDDFDVVYRINP